MAAVTDRHPLTPRLVLARRYRIAGHEQIVQPTGPRQACIMRRVEDASGGFQATLGTFKGQMLQELFRADADPAAAQAPEMELAELDLIGDLRQRVLILEVLAHIGQRLRDTLVVARRLEIIMLNGYPPSSPATRKLSTGLS